MSSSASNGNGKKADGKKADTPQWVSLAAGSTAGAVEAAATYPFEFAKTRVQLSGGKLPRNPFQVVGDVYKQEGFRALYKGCSTLVVGSIFKDGIRFLSFDSIRNAFKDRESDTLTPARSLLAGMAAGVVASFTAVTPTERLKTALIDDAARTSMGQPATFRSPYDAVITLIRRDGFVQGLYRGWEGTTLKQAGATAARLGSYNIIKDAEKGFGIQQSTPITFLNGAAAGTITVYTTQPFDTLKTRGQSAKGASVVDAFQSIIKTSGVRGFWRGSVMRLSRVVWSGGM
ncbi:MAG: hypothetical protein Q9162_007740 [Coniocarpon cinnabarinum]